MEVITKNAQETFKLGKEIASRLRGGEVLALSGPLGAGKTVFVQGLAVGLGIEKRVVSPSYVLMREYEMSKFGKQAKLYHVDFYRLESAGEEVESLGLSEIWRGGEDVLVIEWAEKAAKKLPDNVWWIEFGGAGDEERVIKLNF